MLRYVAKVTENSWLGYGAFQRKIKEEGCISRKNYQETLCDMVKAQLGSGIAFSKEFTPHIRITVGGVERWYRKVRVLPCGPYGREAGGGEGQRGG